MCHCPFTKKELIKLEKGELFNLVEGVLGGKKIQGKHLQNVEVTMCSICYLKEDKASHYHHF